MKPINYIVSLMLVLVTAGLTFTGCYKEDPIPQASSNPVADLVDPGEGEAGTMITLTGSGLGQMKSIVFSNGNVPAQFNPALNSDNVVIFRVPDTANGGPQEIVLTNTKEVELKIPFKVLALASVTGVSTYEFENGSTLALTGNNLETVNKVVLEGTTDAATIVSKSKSKLELKMPASNANRGKLRISNASGDIVTTQEFSNLAKAFIYFKDDFGAGVENWSWATVSPSSSQVHLGSSALKADYGNGAWQGVQFRYGPKVVANDYTFFSFWVKGGTQDNALKIYSDDGGTPIESLTVPKDVWTYVKIPIVGFMSGVNIEKLVFQMRGPQNQAQTVYFDNVIFVK